MADDYPNGEAPQSALYEFRGAFFAPDMFCRVVPAILELEELGFPVTVNQGYRWRGTLKDFEIGQNDHSANEARARETSNGTATQQYVAGRASIGFSSAATVGYSPHGAWRVGAIDCAVYGPGAEAARTRVFRKYGLVANIARESWHFGNVGTPTVPIPSLDQALAMAARGSLQEEDIMASLSEVLDGIAGKLAPMVADAIKPVAAIAQNLSELPSSQAGYIAQIHGQFDYLLKRQARQNELDQWIPLLTKGAHIAELNESIRKSGEYAEYVEAHA